MTRGEFQRREITNNQSNLAYMLVRFQELKPKQNPGCVKFLLYQELYYSRIKVSC